MSVRCLAAVLGIVATLGFVRISAAQDAADPAPSSREETRKTADTPKGDAAEGAKADEAKADEKKPVKTAEMATFGGGCFWCMEAVFERVPGVRSVVSGYAGGSVPFPTYEEVHTGMTGHAEVVQVVFDPRVISYKELLTIFFKSHDPTTPNRQGPDEGTQYRSIILFQDDDQKEAALEVARHLTATRAVRGRIVTQLAPMGQFFPAEMYHQDYFRRNAWTPYSQAYIVPKMHKLSQTLSHLRKAGTSKAKAKAKPKIQAETATPSPAEDTPRQVEP